MMDVRIVGRKGSKAVTRIVNSTSLGRYTEKCDVVVNYGLAGKRMRAFATKHPSITKKPTVNKFIGASKYRAIKDAESAGIEIPKTLLSLPKGTKMASFLTKKMHSQGGKGIEIAKTRTELNGKYYQQFIEDRKYELRVHGFLWVDSEDWLVQKRFGKEGEIAWNYHNGGRFQTVRNPNGYKIFEEAKKITKEVLGMRNMSFGAVDFIVTGGGQLLFLEINSAPGFTEVSEGAYIHAFSTLNAMAKTKILKYCK